MKKQTLSGVFSAFVAGLVFSLLPLAAHAVPITVPGTSDPWLAGMPAGSTAAGGDTAPAHSPVEVLGLSLGLGGALTFTGATGGVLHGPSGCPPICSPIDGSAFFSHSGGDENGISDVRAPINALVGIFLGIAQPDSSAAPAGLNFQVPGGLDFLALSPLLKQVFFIGDGLTSASVVQQFNIPVGATRFFLGTMDGFGWFNNTGAINIEITQQVTEVPTGVPEPATLGLLAVGFGVLGYLRRRTKALTDSAI